MTIPTPRTPVGQPALIWHRDGDFSSEPVRFGQDDLRGTAIQAADELMTFHDVVRTVVRSDTRVDVRYSNGRIRAWIGSPVLPDEIATSDVAEWETSTRRLGPAQVAAIAELLHAVADEAGGDLLRQQAERLLVDLVGPSVAAKENA